ncbi:hypothetical protein BZG36_00616 [Bifiguratus adelaidae]|uniref:Farnesyl pyrophosphate synthase n=1 Tax=Bifiguratus adelaidae TaxID=1938954 RepID=A0A261Y757_9FUNG|nr:hypothetical protein BZG36_00616 [Bifiguratus adelaidae]
MTADAKVSKQQALNDFNAVYPILRDEMLAEVKKYNMPENAYNWFKESMDYNVPGGKLNRGLSVVDTLRILKGSSITEDDLFKARILGWAVEWLQAFFLVADDLMDQSVTRRGQPCWFRREGINLVAINDSFLLESCIYIMLKKHFKAESYYVDLLELFHEVSFQTELGQLLDLITAPEDDVDLNRFSPAKHQFIVIFKTAYYSFYLPVAMAMMMAGVKDEAAYNQAREILLPLGEYFQVQDDYLDCYGDPAFIGKIGTDIQDNKCSWLINQALVKVTPEQRKVLDEHYGKRNAESEAKVKEIYKELDLESVYRVYEDQSHKHISSLIEQVDESKGVKRQVFYEFMNKIYKRTK